MGLLTGSCLFSKSAFKAVLKVLVYMIVWFDSNVMRVDVVNVVMFYFVIISDTMNKFLHWDNKDLLNWIE